MSGKAVLALDQGTTGTTCLILDRRLETLGSAYAELPQVYPRAGWVSHDPEAIWDTSLTAMRGALKASGLAAGDLAAVGITNQRETTMMWDRKTGRPIDLAIVWQCRRTASIIDRWRAREGTDELVQLKTGLLPDAYFSASKVAWFLEQHEGLHSACELGEVCFGTVDSWLLWKMTGGKVHATEPSNASRTMLYNIREGRWDEELLTRFGIPAETLPQVKPTVGEFGVLQADVLGAEVPIMGIAGDQQAALFGQACFSPGEAKNTYGTGCFLVMNTGTEMVYSRNRLLCTVAWEIDGVTEYALEGSVFSAGSAVQWLRDGLGLIKTAAETEELARSVASTEGVYLVPAFNGLGAPYWDMYARGTIVGMTRGTGRAHLARAVLESVAFQSRDLVEAMTADSGTSIATLRTDGGMVANNFLMQFQADVLGVEVERPRNIQSTAVGAGCLAGLGAGLFKNRDEIAERREVEARFSPAMAEQPRQAVYEGWKRAVERARGWEQP